jgi:hypothetical protein
MTEVYGLAVILVICVIGGIAGQFLSPDLFFDPDHAHAFCDN